MNFCVDYVTEIILKSFKTLNYIEIYDQIQNLRL